jgi:hypothetical protein
VTADFTIRQSDPKLDEERLTGMKLTKLTSKILESIRPSFAESGRNPHPAKRGNLDLARDGAQHRRYTSHYEDLLN